MNTQSINKLGLFTGILVAIGMPAAGAFAQEETQVQLDEVIVTAAYREQGLQDVPVSISAVTGRRILIWK